LQPPLLDNQLLQQPASDLALEYFCCLLPEHINSGLMSNLPATNSINSSMVRLGLYFFVFFDQIFLCLFFQPCQTASGTTLMLLCQFKQVEFRCFFIKSNNAFATLGIGGMGN
jgi:hypothetical protein